jgi:alpha-ribazole phosphatase
MLVDLLRHGETDMTGRLLGRTDATLSDAGWQQFERQTERCLFDVVVTSPRQRARLPAEAFAQVRGVPLRIDEDWAEIDFGAWDGRVLSELHADAAIAPALMAMYESPSSPGAPGGEDWQSLEARVGRAVERLFAFEADARVLVSTHAGPMRAALAVACGIPFAALWAVRIGLGTRITLQLGKNSDGARWGEIVEVMQP